MLALSHQCSAGQSVSEWCLVSESNTDTPMLVRRESHWPVSLNLPFHTYPTPFPQKASLNVPRDRNRPRSIQHRAIINTWAVGKPRTNITCLIFSLSPLQVCRGEGAQELVFFHKIGSPGMVQERRRCFSLWPGIRALFLKGVARPHS